MEFYMNNYADILEKYQGKFLLISQGKIISVCNNFLDGYFTARKEGLGITDYIIMPCVPESPLGILEDKVS